MRHFLKKIIKNKYLYIILICFLASIFVTAVVALNEWDEGYRVDSGGTVTVDINTSEGSSYDDCRQVTNISTDKSYFIPTKTEAEWIAFKNAVEGELAPYLELDMCLAINMCNYLGDEASDGQERFVVNRNIVTDNFVNLVWVRDGDLDGAKDWDSALSYCKDLTIGTYYWRLPDQKELQSLLDLDRASAPIIDTSIFNNTQSSDYWSSVTYASSTDLAYGVDFSKGISAKDLKTQSKHVRCVTGSGDTCDAVISCDGCNQGTSCGLSVLSQFGSTDGDRVYGAVADSNNENIYITGNTVGSLDGFASQGGGDAFIAKYNTNTGATTILAQFGSSAYDRAQAIAIDDNDDVYVAGYTYGSLEGFPNLGLNDAFIAKYDSGTGLTTILAQFGSFGNDYAKAITVSGNNIYVAGYTGSSLGGFSNLGNWDAFIAKYDISTGLVTILSQFGSSDADNLHAIAVSGNDVYAAGSTQGDLEGTGSGGYDVFIAKYDGSATTILSQFGSSGYDHANSIAIDDNDYIYVSGHTTGDLGAFSNQGTAGTNDAFIARYNGSATTILSQFGSPSDDIANAITIDNMNDVYVTGYTGGHLGRFLNRGSYNDAFIAKYDVNENATTILFQFGSPYDDVASAVAIDYRNMIYIAGYTYGDLGELNSQGDEDIFIAKYNVYSECDGVSSCAVACYPTFCAACLQGDCDSTDGCDWNSSSNACENCAIDGPSGCNSQDNCEAIGYVWNVSVCELPPCILNTVLNCKACAEKTGDSCGGGTNECIGAYACGGNCDADYIREGQSCNAGSGECSANGVCVYLGNMDHYLSNYANNAEQPGRFVATSSGLVVLDNATGLMWVKDGDLGGTMSWQDAVEYCKGDIGTSGLYADYDDWRLPDQKELQSLWDLTDDTAPIIDSIFENTLLGYYWSSTTYADDTSKAYGVHFSYGNSGYTNKPNNYAVRCVR